VVPENSGATAIYPVTLHPLLRAGQGRAKEEI
jgi:hypothetical protein